MPLPTYFMTPAGLKAVRRRAALDKLRNQLRREDRAARQAVLGADLSNIELRVLAQYPELVTDPYHCPLRPEDGPTTGRMMGDTL